MHKAIQFKMGISSDLPSVSMQSDHPCNGHHYLQGYLVSLMERHGKKIAQVDSETGETVTFNELLSGARTLAKELESRGLRPGFVAMVIGENSIHYNWVLLGILLTGATAHLVNPRSTSRELAHAVSVSKPRVVLVSSEVSAALKEEEYLQHVLVWGGQGLGCVTELRSPTGEPPCEVQEQLLHSEDDHAKGCGNNAVALVLSSSGTTGLPKGVMLTHHNLLSSLRIGALGDLVQLSDGDVVAGILPNYHVFGSLVNLTALSLGVPVVIMARFPGVTGLLSLIKRHGCTALILVPSLLASLSELPGFTQAELPALRCVETGGSPLSPAVQAEVRRRLPRARLLGAYGLTETCLTVLHAQHAEARTDKRGCTGLPAREVQCKIVDSTTGCELPRGHRGELCLRSPTIMKGYISNIAATGEHLDPEGWLHTGDVAYVDDDGYYFIVERKKYIFKYNGKQVSPTELELLLCTHPAVLDAAVIGVPHKYGEAPLALVVLAKGVSVTERVLQTFIEDKVEPQKKLRGGVHFVESLPRNRSGKLQREDLPLLLRPVHQLDHPIPAN